MRGPSCSSVTFIGSGLSYSDRDLYGDRCLVGLVADSSKRPTRDLKGGMMDASLVDLYQHGSEEVTSLGQYGDIPTDVFHLSSLRIVGVVRCPSIMLMPIRV